MMRVCRRYTATRTAANQGTEIATPLRNGALRIHAGTGISRPPVWQDPAWKSPLRRPAHSSRHSDVVKLGKKPGDLQQWINHPTVQNRVEMAAVERPTIEPQLNALREQILDLLAGCDFASNGGVHLVIVVKHGRRTQKLHACEPWRVPGCALPRSISIRVRSRRTPRRPASARRRRAKSWRRRWRGRRSCRGWLWPRQSRSPKQKPARIARAAVAPGAGDTRRHGSRSRRKRWRSTEWGPPWRAEAIPRKEPARLFPTPRAAEEDRRSPLACRSAWESRHRTMLFRPSDAWRRMPTSNPMSQARYTAKTRRPFSTGAGRSWKNPINNTEVMPTSSHPAASRSNEPAANASKDPNAKRCSKRKNRKKPRSRWR